MWTVESNLTWPPEPQLARPQTPPSDTFGTERDSSCEPELITCITDVTEWELIPAAGSTSVGKTDCRGAEALREQCHSHMWVGVNIQFVCIFFPMHCIFPLTLANCYLLLDICRLHKYRSHNPIKDK